VHPLPLLCCCCCCCWCSRQALLLHLYQDVLGPYWAERRRLVEVGYRGIEPGTEHFGLVVRRELETQQQQSVDGLVSSSAWLLAARCW
jgi:hypothetical protein